MLSMLLNLHKRLRVGCQLQKRRELVSGRTLEIDIVLVRDGKKVITLVDFDRLDVYAFCVPERYFESSKTSRQYAGRVG